MAGRRGSRTRTRSARARRCRTSCSARSRPRPSPPTSGRPARRTAKRGSRRSRIPSGISSRRRGAGGAGQGAGRQRRLPRLPRVRAGRVAAPLGADKDIAPNLGNDRAGRRRAAIHLLVDQGSARLLPRSAHAEPAAERRRGPRDHLVPAEPLGAGRAGRRSRLPRSRTRSSPKQGEALVRKYGCCGCHEIPGMEYESRIGVELSIFASKPLEELFFGNNTDIDRPGTLDLQQAQEPRASTRPSASSSSCRSSCSPRRTSRRSASSCRAAPSRSRRRASGRPGNDTRLRTDRPAGGSSSATTASAAT